MWICRYPRPMIFTYKCGKQFLGQAFKNDIIENKYCIKDNCSTTADPQANSILEIIHQVISNLVRNFESQNN